MTDEIVWEDPPESRHGGGGESLWDKRLAPLRERPGQWANIGQHQSSFVTRIRQGALPGISAGEFEAVGRNKVKSKVTIYARYVGQPDLKAVNE